MDFIACGTIRTNAALGNSNVGFAIKIVVGRIEKISKTKWRTFCEAEYTQIFAGKGLTVFACIQFNAACTFA